MIYSNSHIEVVNFLRKVDFIFDYIQPFNDCLKDSTGYYGDLLLPTKITERKYCFDVTLHELCHCIEIQPKNT